MLPEVSKGGMKGTALHARIGWNGTKEIARNANRQWRSFQKIIIDCYNYLNNNCHPQMEMNTHKDIERELLEQMVRERRVSLKAFQETD